MELTDVRKLADAVKENKSLVGIRDTVDYVLITLLCGRHVLLEDFPASEDDAGKCLARSPTDKRIQHWICCLILPG